MYTPAIFARLLLLYFASRPFIIRVIYTRRYIWFFFILKFSRQSMCIRHIYTGAVVRDTENVCGRKINRAYYYYYYTPDCVGMKKNNSNGLFRRNRFIIARCYFSPSVFRPRSSGFDDDFRTETYLCTYMYIYIYTISESARLFPFDSHCMLIMYGSVSNVFEHKN